ncbi:MAG: LysR family transcriptional regulator [Azospira sp.]|jgi:molybdate transport system regulatory protein|nr:LysR family transcriptional regulator [Azospira sp.]
MPRKPRHTAASGPRLRVLLGASIAIGPGKADLLDAIGRSGSISAAARTLGMSYRRAWLLVEATNDAFVEPLVSTATGGSGGGGAQLTDFGRIVLDRYRRMEYRAAAAIAREFDEFRALLRPQVETGGEAGVEAVAAGKTGAGKVGAGAAGTVKADAGKAGKAEKAGRKENG